MSRVLGVDGVVMKETWSCPDAGLADLVVLTSRRAADAAGVDRRHIMHIYLYIYCSSLGPVFFCRVSVGGAADSKQYKVNTQNLPECLKIEIFLLTTVASKRHGC
jgi:hypothetical protein